MPRAPRQRRLRNTGDSPTVYMVHKERKVLTSLPETYEDIEIAACRLFSIPLENQLTVYVLIPNLSDSESEIDPAIWVMMKERVTSIRIVDEFSARRAKDDAGMNREIVVKLRDPTGRDSLFVVRPSISFSALAKAYADKHALNLYRIRLMYDAERWGSNSLEELNVQNGDVIDVYFEQVGGKPVIYLFSPTRISARVCLHLVPEWSFSAIYPTSNIEEGNDGQKIAWDVIVHPEGTMTDKLTGSNVSYLYWEARSNQKPKQVASPPASRPSSPDTALENSSLVFDPSNPDVNPGNSVLLPINDVPLYLDKVLLALGLHTEARTSFITYWLPNLLEHAHIALRFLPQADYEAAAPLDVSPAPSNVTRIFMLWKGLLPCEVEEEEEGWGEAIKRRGEMDVTNWRDIVGISNSDDASQDGLRVLEWGGMEVQRGF